MNTPSEMDQIVSAINENKEKLERYEQLKRLEENPDFNSLFIEGLAEEAIRLVNAKAYPANINNDERELYIERRMIMISQFNLLRQQIGAEGESAYASLEANEREREELLMEDVANG